MRRGTGNSDHFVAAGVADRVSSYEYAHLDESRHPMLVEDDLVEKAATLLLVMPPHQPRSTIAELLAPHDPERGDRAITALIDAALATEDAFGRLRRLD